MKTILWCLLICVGIGAGFIFGRESRPPRVEAMRASSSEPVKAPEQLKPPGKVAAVSASTESPQHKRSVADIIAAKGRSAQVFGLLSALSELKAAELQGFLSETENARLDGLIDPVSAALLIEAVSSQLL